MVFQRPRVTTFLDSSNGLQLKIRNLVYSLFMSFHSQVHIHGRASISNSFCRLVRFGAYCNTKSRQFDMRRSKDHHLCFTVIYFQSISQHPNTYIINSHSKDFTALYILDISLWSNEIYNCVSSAQLCIDMQCCRVISKTNSREPKTNSCSTPNKSSASRDIPSTTVKFVCC